MSEWRVAPLREIADIRVSNVDKKATPGEAPVRLCNYMDVYANDYIRADLPFMEATATATEIQRFGVQQGDVMITKDSETPDDIGIPAVVMDQIEGLVCGYHLAQIRPNRALVDPVYLAKQLALPKTAAYFAQRAAGSTRYGLSNQTIAEVPIRLAPLGQQLRIAEILARIDGAIERTELLIEKHQQVKAGLLHDLFTCGALAGGNLRPAPAVAPGDYQVTEFGQLPLGWSVSTLRGCLSEGAGNGIYKPPHLIGSGTLLIGQTALTEDRSVEPRLARRATVSAQDLRRFGLVAGDILIARVFATVEGVGRPALVPELGEPAVFESNMMRLRVNAAMIRPRLLFEWLKGDVSRRHIAGRANASNQVSVNQGVLYPLPVPVPPPDEQDRMLARIEAADARRVADLATLSKLRAQKHGLMQDLLTGKVRVPLAETASA